MNNKSTLELVEDFAKARNGLIIAICEAFKLDKFLKFIVSKIDKIMKL